MNKTIYEPQKQTFSDKAHIAARTLLYPRLFKTENLIFEDVKMGENERYRLLDGEMGVDRIVKVKLKELQSDLCFTFQERFRQADKAGYRSLTVTEWNHSSNLPSELYKICSGYFLYGYFNGSDFVESIVVNVPSLLLYIVQKRIIFTRQWNPKNQTYLEFSFNELEKAGLIEYHYPDKFKKFLVPS